jgi:putative MATE family efflux protein
MIGMVGLSCYILADTFFIANRLGSDGLAALNIALPAYNLIYGIGSMLGIGGATRYSIASAQNNKKAANGSFTAACLLAMAAAAVFMLLGALFSGEIARLLGAGDGIFAMTHTYLRVLLLFSPAYLMNQVLINFTRNDGAPRLTMVAMLSGSLFNIIFDYIFLYPLNLGILGAVLATGFSPVVGMLVLSLHKIQKRNGFHLEWKSVSPSAFLSCLSLGLPSLIAELSSGAVMVVYNYLLLGLGGTIPVAAYGVVANIAIVVLSIFNGIAQGMQPLVSQAYGGGDRRTGVRTLGYALVTVAGVSAALYCMIYFLADPIAAAFNSEHSSLLQQLAVTGLRIYFVGSVFAGANIVLSMYFSSVEWPLPAQVISLCRGLTVIVPMAIFLARTLGIRGVWAAFPVSEGVVMVVSIVLYGRYRKRETN